MPIPGNPETVTTDSSSTQPPLNAERPDPPGEQPEAPDLDVADVDVDDQDRVEPDSAGSGEAEAPD